MKTMRLILKIFIIIIFSVIMMICIGTKNTYAIEDSRANLGARNEFR